MFKKLLLSLLLSTVLIAVWEGFTESSAIAVDTDVSSPTPQTLNILGAYGNNLTTDPYTEFSVDQGQTWRRAFLYAGHPWGYVEGTNTWFNCGPGGFYCLGSNVLYRVRFYMPETFANPQTNYQFKADNAVRFWLNNYEVGYFETQGTVTGSTYANSMLSPGLNEVKMLLIDSGGWAGLNFKITIQADAASAPTLVTAPITYLPPPAISSNTTSPTKEDVTVTIAYPADAVIMQYKMDGSDWYTTSAYATQLIRPSNGVIYARWIDANGTTSEQASYTIANIDKTPPTTPTLTASTTNPTNASVKVTIGNWGDAVTKEYRIRGGAWQHAPDPAEILMNANGTVEARGTDSIGNVSVIGTIGITNIVADSDPVKIVAAALAITGSELAVHFNHSLNVQSSLDKEAFHLKGAEVPILSLRYVGDQTVLLELDLSGTGAGTLPSLTLDIDSGAVEDQGGKQILAWKDLSVQSQSTAVQLKNQLLQSGSGFPADGKIRIDQVVGYMLNSRTDVTGDGIFDRQDVHFLLTQILLQY